jgi:hypothetical protein
MSGVAVTVAALSAGLFFARRAFDSYDSQVMFVVAKSIVTTHTTYVPRASDPLALNSPHASYGLGQSLADVPAYLLANGTGHDPVTLAMLVNPVLFGAVALVIWAWARTAWATAAQAAAVALATTFGTMLLAYTSTGFSEMGTALGVAIALVGVELTGRRPLAGSVVAGAGVAVAVLWRPDSAVLVAIPVAVAVLVRTRRGFPVFLLTTLPVAALTVAYNAARGAQYAGVPLSQSFTHPLLAGLYGLLLSPGRGLLFYVPLVVLAVVGIPWASRRSPVITGLCLVLIAVRVLFYAKWYVWQAGWAWGPRFLVPAMPCFAPLLFESIRRASITWNRLPLVAAGAAILALSVSVQVLGAAVRYDTDTVNLTMTAVWRADSIPQDQVMFNWQYFPILEHARELHHGRNIAMGYRGGVGLPYN